MDIQSRFPTIFNSAQTHCGEGGELALSIFKNAGGAHKGFIAMAENYTLGGATG